MCASFSGAMIVTTDTTGSEPCQRHSSRRLALGCVKREEREEDNNIIIKKNNNNNNFFFITILFYN